MNKEFIPYEEALELKELGFDEDCLYGYDTFKTIISTSTKWENWNKSLQLVSAPLYQQAFRWFREKYDYRVWVQWGSEYMSLSYIQQPDGHIKNISYHTTNEEAELACLRKLIEIVKNK